MNARANPADWTVGAAKWAAVGALGLASLVGLAWALASAQVAPRLTASPSPAEAVPDARTAISPAGKTPAPRQAFVGTLNVNTASAHELEALPGIGPALAVRIVDDRTEHGPFKSIEDLDRVRGIGPKTLERLRPFIRTE